ncbi:MAG: VWA domain-containing protein [Gammaproteobacteria bacterium]|nr:VWA domain-containing protein [Gammaproteobacteria bacterium]
MLGFDWWWAMLLLPLPLLARSLLPTADNADVALAVPLLNQHRLTDASSNKSSARFARICFWLFWICLVAAASRPYWLGDPLSRTISGRDLMLAVDISGSMSETDMTINSKTASRIEVLKVVVEKFIQRREGDRLGLILFGTNAYTYVPLTFDLDTLSKLLADTSTGLAGRHTAIGDAIGLAVKTMREQDNEHRVLILVTDGSNTAGFGNPVIAAQAARQQGLTIYTIGVGTDAQTLGRTYGLNNIPTGVALNERVLGKIAEVTGGEYFRATNAQALEKIYLTLDELEPVEYNYQSHRPRSELFTLPLASGILLMVCFTAWSTWQSRSSGAV